MTIVETASGKVEGRAEAGLHVFRGIPYAAATGGDNRLRAPRPVPSWTDVRPATEFGCWAPQNAPLTTLSGEVPGAQGEDCLTVNVWTPGVEGRRPVMVWIHGGGFVGGSAVSALYDGANLAARGDVVVVTVNYRLGILGFLAHPDLADDAAEGAAGNWGLLDQVAALRWVRDNIAAFGGDPANVTIFGESAGGMSVADLLTLPSARGLFHRAIVQSGPPNAVAMDRAEEVTAKLLAELGVASPAAVRELPVETVLAAQASLLADRRAGLPLVPVVDGASLPVSPRQALADGAARDVSLLIGTNRDEAKMFMVADPANRDPDEGVLHRRIEAIFRYNDVTLGPDDVIDAYRDARAGRGDPTDPRELWSAIETDRMFRIGSIRAAEAQTAYAPTYMYLFTWQSPAMRGALGACHALEIPFVFGTLGAPAMDRFAGSGPEAERLSEQMRDAWLEFARTGDPNHAGIPAWPTYDATRRATMEFGLQTRVLDAPYDEERTVWGLAG
ncbi:MAG TPA: carboxylesterase/lipase family protein [Mycobacteriales bacterium]|nr:carboxylesterase/lipase family protein [Mycobacteriales bacterium]